MHLSRFAIASAADAKKIHWGGTRSIPPRAEKYRYWWHPMSTTEPYRAQYLTKWVQPRGQSKGSSASPQAPPRDCAVTREAVTIAVSPQPFKDNLGQ